MLEQVEYLQSHGMDEKEAISLLIRGFVGTDIEGLGKELNVRIAEIAELLDMGKVKIIIIILRQMEELK